MEAEQQRNANIILQTVMTVFLGVLVAINGFALNEISILGKQVISNTVKIDSFMSEGPRFTADGDAIHLRQRVVDIEKELKILDKKVQ
jgi:hypothetical protein